MKITLQLLAACLVAYCPLSSASEGLVRVVIGKSSAAANTPLGVGSRLTTSAKNRSEVSLDNGMVRTGSNTSLRIAGKDDVALEKGLALVAAKPRFFRRSVSVGTLQHRMKVRGTAQIYHEPGRSLRVVVIEGKMTVSLNSMTGESVTLGAGQVLVINPSENDLPEPMEIDLNRLSSTAALLHERADALPTVELVHRAGRRQALEIDRGGSVGAPGLGAGGSDGIGGADIYARTEELVHEAIVDEIGDLDGDGEPDTDDFDDNDFDDEDTSDGDDPGDDDPDTDDGGAGDEPDGGGGDDS
jgi:hypothetical protein